MKQKVKTLKNNGKIRSYENLDYKHSYNNNNDEKGSSKYEAKSSLYRSNYNTEDNEYKADSKDNSNIVYYTNYDDKYTNSTTNEYTLNTLQSKLRSKLNYFNLHSMEVLIMLSVTIIMSHSYILR